MPTSFRHCRPQKVIRRRPPCLAGQEQRGVGWDRKITYLNFREFCVNLPDLSIDFSTELIPEKMIRDFNFDSGFRKKGSLGQCHFQFFSVLFPFSSVFLLLSFRFLLFSSVCSVSFSFCFSVFFHFCCFFLIKKWGDTVRETPIAKP